jgi:hypothetical protein
MAAPPVWGDEHHREKEFFAVDKKACIDEDGFAHGLFILV